MEGGLVWNEEGRGVCRLKFQYKEELAASADSCIYREVTCLGSRDVHDIVDC